MNQVSTLEQEKQQLKKDIDTERERVHRLHDEKEKLVLSSNAQTRRVELLESTLKENAAQLMIQQQENKELAQEVRV
jgi:hypothetical protein